MAHIGVGIRKPMEQLTAAEAMAYEIVATARRNRLQMLRQANEKAAEEVNFFRAEQEAKFQAEKTARISVDTATEFVEAARAEVDRVEADYAANKVKTVDYVVSKVLEVPTELSPTQKMVVANMPQELKICRALAKIGKDTPAFNNELLAWCHEGQHLGQTAAKSSLFDALRNKNVRLFRPQFLIDRFSSSAGRIPCHQDIPDEGFLDVSGFEEEELLKLVVVAIGYYWASPKQPDRQPESDSYHLTYLRLPPEQSLAASVSPEPSHHDSESDGERNETDGANGADGSDEDEVVQPPNHVEAAVANTSSGGSHVEKFDTFEAVIADASKLTFEKMPFSEDDWLHVLHLAGSICPNLIVLNLSKNPKMRLSLDMFASLVNLNRLNLSSTGVTGDLAALEVLVNLTRLDLSSTRVSGDIAALALLLNLERLNLVHSGVAGNVSALATLQNLSELFLFRIGVSGSVAAFASLVNLSVLDLSSTRVTGDLKAFAVLVNLTRLDLSSSGVSGDVAFVAALVNIARLNLSQTGVKGDIAAVAALVHLTRLDLSSTGVTGDVTALGTAVNLTELSLFKTSVAGDIAALGNLKHVTALDLSNTAVTGNLAALATVPKIRRLNLVRTGVFGDVAALADSVNLAGVHLAHTDISGDIAALATLVNVNWLNLSYTGVTGDVTALANLVNLSTVSLAGTSVTGDYNAPAKNSM